jgi:RimJ/RimL family protein N-acetyltransferase
MTYREPEHKLFHGRWVDLIPLDPETQGRELYEAASLEANGGADIFRWWSHGGPFYDFETFDANLRQKAASTTGRSWAVRSHRLNRLVGGFTLFEYAEGTGGIEIGAIWYGKVAQRSEINTSTLATIFPPIFEEWGYRRLQWRCNAKNTASRAAAERAGFTYEGTFRNHSISKGENRDTAWLSIIVEEWPVVKKRLLALEARA